MNCQYTKTFTGKCDQQARPTREFCYYHEKVLLGLMESDPILSLRQSQTIVNR